MIDGRVDREEIDWWDTNQSSWRAFCLLFSPMIQIIPYFYQCYYSSSGDQCSLSCSMHLLQETKLGPLFRTPTPITLQQMTGNPQLEDLFIDPSVEAFLP